MSDELRIGPRFPLLASILIVAALFGREDLVFAAPIQADCAKGFLSPLSDEGLALGARQFLFSSVRGLAQSPQGTWLANASGEICEVSTGKLKQVLRFEESALCVAFPDEKHVAFIMKRRQLTGAETLHLFHIDSGRLVRIVDLKQAIPANARVRTAFSADGAKVVVAAECGRDEQNVVHIFDAISGKESALFQSKHGCYLSQTDLTVVIASEFTLQVVEPFTAQQIAELPLPKAACDPRVKFINAELSPGQRYLALTLVVRSSNFEARLVQGVNLFDLSENGRIEPVSSAVRCSQAYFSRSGRYVCLISNKTTFYDLERRVVTRTIDCVTVPLFDLGGRLCFLGLDGDCLRLDISTWQCAALHTKPTYILGTAFSVDGRELYVLDRDASLALWDVSTASSPTLQALPCPADRRRLRGFDAFDEHQLSVATCDEQGVGEFGIWNTREAAWDFEKLRLTGSEVVLDADSLTKRVALQSLSGVAIHHLENKDPPVRIVNSPWRRHATELNTYVPFGNGWFMPFLDTLVTLDKGREPGGRLQFWNLRLEQPVHSDQFDNPLLAVTHAKSGLFFAAPNGRGFSVWETLTGELVADVTVVNGRFRGCIAFSPDNRHIWYFVDAVPGRGAGMLAFDLLANRIAGVVPCHNPDSASFSPNGKYLACVYDQQLRLSKINIPSSLAELDTSPFDDSLLLLDDSAFHAYPALGRVIGNPAKFISSCRAALVAPRDHTPDGFETLVPRLVASDPSTRARARDEARSRGRSSLTAVTAALAHSLTAPVKWELNQLYGELTSPVPRATERRKLRMIMGLEMLGTPDADRLLSDLIVGSPDLYETTLARATWKRRKLRLHLE